MVEVTATICNEMGIHCRPSAIIVKATRGYRGKIELAAPNGSCDPRSILDLISLGLTKDTRVTLRVSGRSEKKFALELVHLFERRFDFPPDPDSISPLVKAAPIGSA